MRTLRSAERQLDHRGQAQLLLAIPPELLDRILDRAEESGFAGPQRDFLKLLLTLGLEAYEHAVVSANGGPSVRDGA